MSLHATRALLLGNLLRRGDRRRVARLFDRLEAGELGVLLQRLDALGLRRAAAILLDEYRVAKSVAELEADPLSRLLVAADASDAQRALTWLPLRRARAVLSRVPRIKRRQLLAAVDETRRRRLQRALPRRIRPDARSERRLGPVLRLRRIFAA